MLLRTCSLSVLVASLGACGAARPELPPAAPSEPAVAAAARPRDPALFYAYTSLASEMARLRESGGRGRFSVRRALDKIADVLESLPEREGVGAGAAAVEIRSDVTQLIESSPSPGARAGATRRALERTGGVLRRLAEGPCRGDLVLLHRVDQLDEAIAALPDDPTLAHVSLGAIVVALDRTQGALLALATTDNARAWPAAAPRGELVTARAADVGAVE